MCVSFAFCFNPKFSMKTINFINSVELISACFYCSKLTFLLFSLVEQEHIENNQQ